MQQNREFARWRRIRCLFLRMGCSGLLLAAGLPLRAGEVTATFSGIGIASPNPAKVNDTVNTGVLNLNISAPAKVGEQTRVSTNVGEFFMSAMQFDVPTPNDYLSGYFLTVGQKAMSILVSLPSSTAKYKYYDPPTQSTKTVTHKLVGSETFDFSVDIESSSGPSRSVAVSIPALVSVDQTDIPITATISSSDTHANLAGVPVTFSCPDLTFSSSTATTDTNGKATVTATAGSSPSASLNDKAIAVFAGQGYGSNNAAFTIVEVKNPSPENPRILDGGYEDNSLYTVVLTYAVTPAIPNVPLTFAFDLGPTELNGVNYPAKLEEATLATDSEGKATVRVRSSDLRQALKVKCTFEKSSGSTSVWFEGITGVTGTNQNNN